MRIQRDAQTIRTHLQGDINPFYTLTPGIQELMLEPKTKGSDMQFWEKCTWCKKKKKYTVQIHCDGEEKRKKDTSKKHWKGFKSTRYDSNAQKTNSLEVLFQDESFQISMAALCLYQSDIQAWLRQSDLSFDAQQS